MLELPTDPAQIPDIIVYLVRSASDYDLTQKQKKEEVIRYGEG